ncbi:type II toxin-antitoxin system Phd/YefM family antitoxin [Myxococcota bacterium]
MTVREFNRLKVTEDIVPLSDLSGRISDVLHDLRRRGRPLIIVNEGKPVAVLVTPEEFDRLTYHARFVGAVHEGLLDSDNGRTLSEPELDQEFDGTLAPQEVR